MHPCMHLIPTAKSNSQDVQSNTDHFHRSRHKKTVLLVLIPIMQIVTVNLYSRPTIMGAWHMLPKNIHNKPSVKLLYYITMSQV